MPEEKEILIGHEDEGNRLDIHLAKVFTPTISRSQIQKLIRDGFIKVNGQNVVAHYPIKKGDRVHLIWNVKKEETTRAEEIPLDILYEDEDLIVVNKQAGMVVHPAHGNPHHTMVNALLYHTQSLANVGDAARPGIVHRLDKETSGILVVAKNNQAHAFLANQFKEHTIERVYLALVRGVVQHDEGICEEPVGRAFVSHRKVVVKPSGGKEATTLYSVKKRFRKATLLEVYPKTGRTHQIRVHMAYLGHSVLGDSLYGVSSPWITRQALHAYRLGFSHPRTHEKMSFQSPLPEDMKKLLDHLESEQ